MLNQAEASKPLQQKKMQECNKCKTAGYPNQMIGFEKTGNKYTKLKDLRKAVDGILRLQSKTALDDDTWRACMKILNEKGLITIWS
jgi:hypothetical protein